MLAQEEREPSPPVGQGEATCLGRPAVLACRDVVEHLEELRRWRGRRERCTRQAHAVRSQHPCSALPMRCPCACSKPTNPNANANPNPNPCACSKPTNPNPNPYSNPKPNPNPNPKPNPTPTLTLALTQAPLFTTRHTSTLAALREELGLGTGGGSKAFKLAQLSEIQVSK